MNAPSLPPLRLTQFSHGGGCGCKIAPGLLQQILRSVEHPLVPKDLLVGIETADDAAVYRLNEHQAIVATTDFFTPIVDDPFDFGAIAATNALSDVYAMGATPLFALAIVGMPIAALPVGVIRRVLEGGQSICARAGIPIAGGHTIDTVEPIYGLVAIGVVDPLRMKRNSDARPGDAIVIGKALGVGIYSAALKRGTLDDTGYRTMVDHATRLNTPGVALAAMEGVHAITDVTGFGLAGHLLEMCRGAALGARIEFAKLPVFA
ncbi:MAG: selenide, water dikinase SelD, partial [Betaproteobacteria bacterium]